ncbi:cysteine ABC transporter ATP-binding/permease subunit CydD (plasmid) [Rhizobium etli 8C-3]|uniref:Cysteine ABC transporter ATP-binding/permease subunit CydD n=2 Tax=Rhizobium TaxID=379 RepID=A0A1L5PFI5_RHIET|nr:MULTISPECIES: thiol reductant ABC exporter subunit CydD [Rhizobium]APO78716.1 cysteine ABC transporter ATP-binding/permease subunit CydD [Rhizobium etli 8C-3]TCU39242.1 ATP-binding cassette subfamily C protein CydD [Rhizobium azibense]
MGTALFDEAKAHAAGASKTGLPARSARPLCLRHAASLQTAASFLWIPQAGLLAHAVGRIADGDGLSHVLWPAFFVLTLGIAKALLDAVGGQIALDSARTELSVRRQFAVAALARRSPIDGTRPASGQVASVLGEQAELVVPYLARYFPARIKASVIPVVMLVCVLAISWVAALALFISMPLIPLFMALIGWRAQVASEKQLAATGKLNAFLLDRLRGLATIRSFNAVELTATRLRADAEDLKTRTMAVLKIAFLSSAVLELFAALGVAMVAVYVGFSLLGEIHFGTWSGKISLTEGFFILLLAPAFFEPLRELSAVWHDRAAGEAAIKALDSLGECGGIEIVDTHSTGPAPGFDRLDIEFNDVSFRYDCLRPCALTGFNCLIEEGEHVALSGASGAGKSTLLALIAGLAPPQTGRVLIDGRPVDAGVRSTMAWIGQTPHIFAGSLAGNVLLHRHYGVLKEALALARLDGVAAAYGKRPLGEGGAGLSGGEALRLAIARAAANPFIRIILADEPTAHLDAVTAAEITESLIALASERTLIVATHDARLAARMDRMILIDAPFSKEAAVSCEN